MNRALVANAPLTVKDQGRTYQAVSDGNGVVKFSETFSETAIVYPVGFGTAIRISCDAMAPSPAYDPPSGVEIEGAITAVCQVLKKTAFGETWFSYRQKFTGYESQWYRGYDLMKAAGLADSQCFLPAPTAPESSGISQGALDAALQALRSQMDEQIQKLSSSLSSLFSDSLTSVVEYLEGMIAGLVAGLRSEIDALSDALTSGLQQTADTLRREFRALVDPIWSALAEFQAAAEEESRAWRASYDGIWGKLESWLIERIVGILLKGLDREVKEMK